MWGCLCMCSAATFPVVARLVRVRLPDRSFLNASSFLQHMPHIHGSHLKHVYIFTLYLSLYCSSTFHFAKQLFAIQWLLPCLTRLVFILYVAFLLHDCLPVTLILPRLLICPPVVAWLAVKWILRTCFHLRSLLSCVTVAGWIKRVALWSSKKAIRKLVDLLRVYWPAFHMLVESIITKVSTSWWDPEFRKDICSHRIQWWLWYRSTATSMHTIW